MKPVKTSKPRTSAPLAVRRETLVVLTDPKLAGVHGGETASAICHPIDA